MADKSTASTAKSTEETSDAPEVAEDVTRAATVDKKPAGTKAYRSDRNLAEVNADEVVYLDPKSEVGARLLATGYFTEVPEAEIP